MRRQQATTTTAGPTSRRRLALLLLLPLLRLLLLLPLRPGRGMLVGRTTRAAAATTGLAGGCHRRPSASPSACCGWLRALSPPPPPPPRPCLAWVGPARTKGSSSSSGSIPTHRQQRPPVVATVVGVTARPQPRASGRTIAKASNGNTGEQPRPPLSQRLWREQAPMARAVLHHPFVRGIGQGVLREGLFKGYAAQDAHFLKAFAKAYAHALTKVEDAHTIAELSACIAAVVEELALHASLGVAHHVQEHKAPASPACEAYTGFLLRVARDPASTVAQVLAAMCPCMRLYAYLGQTLRAALPDAPRPAHLQAWVDAYAGAGFEAAAAKVEALLDREHAKGEGKPAPAGSGGGSHPQADGEGEEEQALRRLYARAMELEYDFFAEHWRTSGEGEGEWRGIDPGLLVTDFDSTCSREDTTHVLAKAAGHFKGPNYSAERWAALEQNYLAELSRVLPPLLDPPDEAARALARGDPAAYLAPLDAFETRLVDTVSDSGVLAGIAMAALPALLRGALAPHLALQPHCAAVLRYAQGRAATADGAFHVLSVSWCPDLIATATGLPRETITCNALEVDPGTGLSTGRIQVVVDGPGGKLRHFRALCEGAQPQPHAGVRRRPPRPTTVFIGDSMTDLLALGRADAGLVVGRSQRLRQLAAALGWRVAPLVAFPVEGAAAEGEGGGGRVLYEAEDWLDIAAALYGRGAVPALLLDAGGDGADGACDGD